MGKVSINESTLVAIGDAIREKTGKTDLIAPGDMPAEIASITTGGGEVEPIVLTGDCEYGCVGPVAGAYIEKFGDTITTKKITNAQDMFKNTPLTKIPFSINIKGGSTMTACRELFYGAAQLTEAPAITGSISDYCKMFQGCYKLKEIPEHVFNGVIFTYFQNINVATSYMFYDCYSLRKVHLYKFIGMRAKQQSSGSSYYYNGFTNCCSLDELTDLPIPYVKPTWTSNTFVNTVNGCNRLKNFIFTVPDGQPVVVNWKSQVLDLSSGVGYAPASNGYDNILNYNSGITADKEVTDDASYQALKNDPDWFTANEAYSRYNHDSAVATINSLPDASAYLATQSSGTNTIKFKGASGSKTDGGAINTLTEEEIAVAAAKGWTVTLV